MDHDEIKDHFLAVYDQYADDIFRFCAMKIASRETAQDISQETFMRFWQQLREGVQVKNERALLYTIARNLVIDWYRRRKEQSLDAMSEGGFEFASDDHGSIADHAQFRQALDAIKELDEPSREALTLRFVEGFSPREIAALSGETPNAVSVRINRGIKKVQQRLRTTDHE